MAITGTDIVKTYAKADGVQNFGTESLEDTGADGIVPGEENAEAERARDDLATKIQEFIDANPMEPNAGIEDALKMSTKISEHVDGLEGIHESDGVANQILKDEIEFAIIGRNIENTTGDDVRRIIRG